MNRHNNYRLFPCEICGKAFLTSRDMKTHMKVHSLPYNCHMCEESFAAKDLLDDHIRKDQRTQLSKNFDHYLLSRGYDKFQTIRH